MKRILVAGLGLIGARHAKAVIEHPSAELVAVVDPNETIRANWDVPAFAKLEDVDVPVDGAILATPSNLHADHAEVCLKRGWPCLIEKPIEVSLEAAGRIVAASDASGLPVLTGHHRRYHASVQKLREIVRNEDIGAPVLANAIWAVRKPDAYFEGNWRAGASGSPIMINTVHDIDVLRFVMGEVTEIMAIGGQPIRKADRVENAIVGLRFESGALVSIAITDTSPSPWGFEAGTLENPNIAGSGQDCLWVMGTKGGISFPSMNHWSGAEDWSQSPTADALDIPKTVPLNAQLSHFLDVLDGAPPLIDAEDAMRTLAVTLEVEAQIAKTL